MPHVPLRKSALSIALLTAGLSLGALAQTTAPAVPMAGDAKLAHGDHKFVVEAAKGGIAEVDLGQLAAQKAQNPDVKRFGQRMVDDHSKANDQLKQIAASRGVELPTAPDRATRREHDKLAKLNGADFDRQYIKHMVSDHQKDVKDFEKEAKSGKDADVKRFASSTLPTLQEHLQMAQRTESSVRGAPSTMPTSAPAPGTPGSTQGVTGGTGGTTPSSNTKPPKGA